MRAFILLLSLSIISILSFSDEGVITKELVIHKS
jgi:hypothetical protein